MEAPLLAPRRYVPDRMRSVGEIVRSRLTEIGMFQKDFAPLVGLDAPAVSRILDGERRLPVEDALAWCEPLRLVGPAAEEFILAVHLSWSTDLVRSLVDRMQIERSDDHALISFYEDKATLIRRVLDAFERAKEDRRKR